MFVVKSILKSIQRFARYSIIALIWIGRLCISVEDRDDNHAINFIFLNTQSPMCPFLWLGLLILRTYFSSIPKPLLYRRKWKPKSNSSYTPVKRLPLFFLQSENSYISPPFHNEQRIRISFASAIIYLKVTAIASI